MLYILYGADDYSVARELDSIKQSAGDQSLLATNTSILDGTQATLDELRVACETYPFLSDKRLVVVYSLLERFGSKTTPASGLERYADMINNLPPSTVLVLVDEELKDTNPLFRMINQNAVVKSFPLLKGDDLKHWVANYINQAGGSITPAGINAITRLIGANLWIMSSELQKLLTYADGRRIEEKDVKAVVSYTGQTTVFILVDAIVEFNLQKAEGCLQQLLKEGESPTGLLGMLNRQMRLIVRAKDLKNQGLSETEIRGRLRLTNEFLVHKVLEQSKRYTLNRLRQVYQQLLETDLSIKTGKCEGELALNILVAELCLPR